MKLSKGISSLKLCISTLAFLFCGHVLADGMVPDTSVVIVNEADGGLYMRYDNPTQAITWCCDNCSGQWPGRTCKPRQSRAVTPDNLKPLSVDENHRKESHCENKTTNCRSSYERQSEQTHVKHWVRDTVASHNKRSQ